METSRQAGEETARLQELARLGVRNEASDEDLNAIVESAAAWFDVPIALVSLVDERRQWFKSGLGLEVPETLRELSICAHAVMGPDDVLVVPNALEDPRFADNPLVVGEPGIRFYAGAPLISTRGFALGSLCLIDRQPREFGRREMRALKALAGLVVRRLEGRHDDSARSLAPIVDSHAAPIAIAVFGWDAELHITSWSRAAQLMMGWDASEVLGQFPPFVLEEDAGAFTRFGHDVLAGADRPAQVSTIRTKAGSRLAVTIGATRVVDRQGECGGVSTIESIGARLEFERRLTMLESVVVNSTDAVIVTTATPIDGVNHPIVYVNAAFTRMTGYAADEVVGKDPAVLQGPDTDPDDAGRIGVALARREPLSVELVNYRKDGSPFWVEFNISPVFDAHGECMYFVSIERETTARRALARYEQDRGLVLEMAVRNEPLITQLARIVMLLKSVIPGSLGTILLNDEGYLRAEAADPELSLEYIRAIDGLAVGPEVGSCGTAIFTGRPVICGEIATDAHWALYRHLAFAAGLRACWSIPFFATDGSVAGAFALYADRSALPSPREMQLLEETARFAALVVDRHRDRVRLERMALFDGLTDLPNRGSIERTLRQMLDRGAASGQCVALGIVDIDRFKAINDAFGHSFGDVLLRRIADRFAATMEHGDVAGRMAGDEFVLLFAQLADACAAVKAATRLLEMFNAPFDVESYEIVVRPSMGLAIYPITATTVAGLFAAADKAMYDAKLRGGGLEVAMVPIDGSALKKLDLEKELRYALDRNQFVLHYQLMFDLADGRPVGAEALLRWNHPTLGMISPNDFIPLAEANGTIVAIGTWAIGEAARMARSWQDVGHDVFVTVNMSALQFDAPGLLAIVVDALRRTDLQPHRLHLELTESLVMRNPTASAATLLQLKALGVRIVIDDFGTGYSSLAYLQRFAFDTLKIDRAFVRGIGDDSSSERSEHIVAAVGQLGAALGVTIIAEGVEDAAQYRFVRSCGCTVVQGFLCALPVAADALRWEYFDDSRTVGDAASRMPARLR